MNARDHEWEERLLGVAGDCQQWAELLDRFCPVDEPHAVERRHGGVRYTPCLHHDGER
jgi:hypothetical protein